MCNEKRVPLEVLVGISEKDPHFMGFVQKIGKNQVWWHTYVT